MTNETLERDVADELRWDPMIGSDGIAVSVGTGIVTLPGTVGGFRQKREVKRTAERIYVVADVNNAFDATAKDGIVILTGTAEWHYQREEAEFVAANVLGVIDIENDLDVVSPVLDTRKSIIPSKRPSRATPSSTPATSR